MVIKYDQARYMLCSDSGGGEGGDKGSSSGDRGSTILHDEPLNVIKQLRERVCLFNLLRAGAGLIVGPQARLTTQQATLAVALRVVVPGLVLVRAPPTTLHFIVVGLDAVGIVLGVALHAFDRHALAFLSIDTLDGRTHKITSGGSARSE